MKHTLPYMCIQLLILATMLSSAEDIKRNIFYCPNEPADFINELPPGRGRTTEDGRGRTLAKARDADTDYSIYYCGVAPELGETMLKKQHRDGLDAYSLAVDPLFVDPEHGDFRFKPDSPALKMGIVPIDLSKIGLRATTDRGAP